MELYHVLNRGVDKREIFLDTADYVRFVHYLYAFNDVKPANNTSRSMVDLGGRPWSGNTHHRKRELLVDLHGWCLMKNHYHLLLSEIVEGGLSKFLMKINVGHAKSFNEKNKRNGTLFQGRTKKILIENESQFQYILHYIHLNPLDYLRGARNWRQRDKDPIHDTKKIFEYLDNYRWSSYKDYCNRKNFPSLLTSKLFAEAYGNYEKNLTAYIKDKGELSSPQTLENKFE